MRTEPVRDTPAAWRAGWTLVVGALLITVLVPCLQWLGRGGMGNSAELDVPTPIAIGLLTALVAITFVLGMLRATRRFNPQTLMLLYVMLTVSVPFCNFGLVQGLFASLTAVTSEHLDRQIKTIRAGYASQDPRFFPKLSEADYKEYTGLAEEAARRPSDSADLQARQVALLRPLKRFWSGVSIDKDAKAGLDRVNAGWWERAHESCRAIPWGTWGPILIAWGILLALVLGGMLLVASRLGQDWIERENLPFPVAQLALGLIASEGTGPEKGQHPVLFRNVYFLGGAVLSALLLLLGGMAHYEFLSLPVTGAVTFQRLDFSLILVSPPWNILADNMLMLSPVMIGLFLLVHQDTLKGCLWVFASLMGLRFAAGLAEPGLRQALGASWQGNGLPYFAELATGAVVVFATVQVWRNRASFARIHWVAWLISAIAIAVWWYIQGLQGWGGLFFLLFFSIWTILAGISIARARAEGGLPFGGTKLSGSEVAFNTGNVATHGIDNVMAFNQSFFITISMLPGLIASTMEGLYLGRHFKVSRRTVLTCVAVGFVVALGVGLLSFLVFSYAYGCQNIQPFLERVAKFPLYDTFHAGDVSYQSGTDRIRILAIPIGVVVMVALLVLRRSFPRFPIPPLSFLLVCLGTFTFQRAGQELHHLHSIPINVVWGPILLAFVIKSLVLRFGGMDLYVRTRPAALGLIFGQAIAMVAWNIFHGLASPEMPLFTGVFQ